jgi:hypothetical protein
MNKKTGRIDHDFSTLSFVYFSGNGPKSGRRVGVFGPGCIGLLVYEQAENGKEKVGLIMVLIVPIWVLQALWYCQSNCCYNLLHARDQT